MTQVYDRLKALLEELFQFDREDLDFGIYRIMNQKRDEVSKFLDDDLLPQVRRAFTEYRGEEEEGARRELEALAKTLGDAGVSAESSPKYVALREKVAGSENVEALETEVYSDLYTFFRRYYKNGDFLSLRRYKEGVYALPYEGEEVKLHWANADQYYVKTAENFRRYRFGIEGGGHVAFELVVAATERDNNKAANGRDRCFVPREEEPVEERDGELRVYFEYRPHPEKQADLNRRSAAEILDHAPAEWKARLAALAPTESRPGRTVLDRHLDEYTARNTFDYFVHKDLGRFLNQELDFFLKNEVLHVDDLDTDDERRVGQYLAKMRVIKRIGRKIVAFLAQIEDFQKKLFLKKKFVVESGYCLTLDNVPEEMYAEISANDAQYEEWEKLFSISAIEPNLENGTGDSRSADWLKANPHLVLDTKFFDGDFKDRLLASIEDLDEKTDGLLVESENFQALDLLQTRYRERVKCIYIDPPYNTGDDGFVYKDNYQHSSWLSLINDRLLQAASLNSDLGAIAVSIDDVEVGRLTEALDRAYDSENELAKLVWDRNRKNDAKFFSVGHEYMLVYAKSRDALNERGVKFREPKEGLKDAHAEFERLRKKHGDDWEEIRKGWLAFFDNIPQSDPRRRLLRFTKVGPRGPYRDDGNINWPGSGGPRYEILHPITKKPVRKPASGWRYKDPARFWEMHEAGKIIFGSNETTVPSTVSYLFESSTQVMPSVFYSYAQTAAQEFNHLFEEERVFDNPKNWRDISRLVAYLTQDTDTTLDFFAGSGTTGHAVINLNREDGGSRKYVLVEMGEYFDSVLKPRIQKVVYSKDWKDGKPVSRESVSHIFKYLRLESYEDTLNNLSLRRTEAQDGALYDDGSEAFREAYTISYMMDFETRGSRSLLDLDAFEDPFSYTLEVARGDETRRETVDLVETFGYLLGLTVRRRYTADGFRVVEGTNPAGEAVLAIWRNTKLKSDDDLGAFFDAGGFAERSFDRVYANGDNTLALKTGDGGPKAHLIEDEFRRLMFETGGV